MYTARNITNQGNGEDMEAMIWQSVTELVSTVESLFWGALFILAFSFLLRIALEGIKALYELCR